MRPPRSISRPIAFQLQILRALTSHWRRRPLQLAALLVGLAAATALWSGVQALNRQARDSYDLAARGFSGAQVAALVAEDGAPLDQAAFARLRRAGWAVSPLVEGWLTLPPGEAAPGGEPDRLRLIGIEPVTLPPEAGLALFAAPGGASRAEGGEGGEGAQTPGDPSAYPAFVLPPGEAFVAPQTLREMGWREGDRPLSPAGPLPPLVASPALAPGVIVADIGFAQPLLGLSGRVGRLLLDPQAPRPGDPPEGLRLSQPEPRADPARLAASFHLNLTAFGALAFIVGLFIAHGAAGLAIEQRRPLFRTLRACGLSARGLALSLSVELALLALAAGLVGVGLGYLIAAALLPDVAISLRGLYGVRASGELSLSPAWWLAGLGMSFAGAALAAGPALWRAARAPALESAHSEATRPDERRRLRRQAALAGLLALVALALAAWGQGLTAAFVLIGATLGAAALALPPLLAWILGEGARRARRPLTLWAFADGRRQLSGLSLALVSLMLALSANIGVGTMVDGFRLTFDDWLDQRLSAQAYLRAAPGGGPRLQAWLGERPEVLAILPEAEVETDVRGWPTELQGFAVHPETQAAVPLISALPDVWDLVGEGRGALVSEQLARRLDLSLGEALEIAAPTGPWPLIVAGIHPDYGNPKGQVRVALPALHAHWPGIETHRFSLHLRAGATSALLADLRAAQDAGLSKAIDQGELKRVSQAVFERTFAVTGALNVLTLGVAGVALLTALLTLAESRLPQVAPLWAMGVTRRRLAGIEMARMLALAALTAGLAVPLGVALAWILSAVVNAEAFGWRLPLHLFPMQWARLGLLAVAVAALAAALPLRRLARTPPATLLKVFADER